MSTDILSSAGKVLSSTCLPDNTCLAVKAQQGSPQRLAAVIAEATRSGLRATAHLRPRRARKKGAVLLVNPETRKILKTTLPRRQQKKHTARKKFTGIWTCGRSCTVVAFFPSALPKHHCPSPRPPRKIKIYSPLPSHFSGC